MRNLISKNRNRKLEIAATDIPIRYLKSEKKKYKQNSLLLLKKRILSIRDRLKLIINVYEESLLQSNDFRKKKKLKNRIIADLKK